MNDLNDQGGKPRTRDPGSAGHGPVEAMSVGLTSAQVAERVADGRVNAVPPDPMPSMARIFATNIFTPVNLIISVMLVMVVIANGISPDMLFGGVVVSNSVIGITQEIRARAALMRLAVLSTPRAVVVRDGRTTEISLEDIVADDILVLDPDGQVVVDGEVVDSKGLELNESLLTGESDSVPKVVGDQVLSGSFVSSGCGLYRAVRIGGESYAAKLAGEARRFSLVDSELRQGINQILKALMLAIPPVAGLLYFRLIRSGQEWHDALSSVVAAAVAMVPDGLVLLTSLSFMAGVVTLARRGALLRELAAVELLARVDTICLDKTGTITTGKMAVASVEEIDPDDASELLAAFAHSDPNPNATQRALIAAFDEPVGVTVGATIPFSSARKWSAAELRPAVGGTTAVFLGAPEMMLGPADDDVIARVNDLASQGYRVLLFATAAALTGSELPRDLRPRVLVLLEDEIRPDSRETLEFFADQGIDLKVISGDNPVTVAAVAERAGVLRAGHGRTAGDTSSAVAIDAREISFDDDAHVDEAVASHTVFGRVTPHQKRDMLISLQRCGHKVAMTGDGVNDVLALKDSDMGIAMGEGSSASRSVAELVLLDNRFDILPGVLAEGRRVVNSIERAANLFVYGTVYSVVISLVIAVLGVKFPFLPRHLTLVRSLTVGIPGIVLALAPDARVARTGFVRRVVRFCIPAGSIAGVVTLLVWFYSLDRIPLDQARTAATVALMSMGLVILGRVAESLPRWRYVLMVVMALLMIGAIAIPISRSFFALALPPVDVWSLIVGTSAVGWLCLRFVPVDGSNGSPQTGCEPGEDPDPSTLVGGDELGLG